MCIYIYTYRYICLRLAAARIFNIISCVSFSSSCRNQGRARVRNRGGALVGI